MDNDTTRQEIDKLRQEIAFHNYRYHVLDQPLISDYEFDQLMRPAAPARGKSIRNLPHPIRPTQRTGGAPSEKFSEGAASISDPEPWQCHDAAGSPTVV
jgi:DNA ligase (NAD+)